MLKKLGMFEIDVDISRTNNDQSLKQIKDDESLKLLASMGVEKMFRGEEFYHAVKLDPFLGRRPTFHFIGTIRNRIYKIHFEFLDDDQAVCVSFREKMREYLCEKMLPLQFNNPRVTQAANDLFSTWHFDWGDILLEETETGFAWNTAIVATSKAVRNAKEIGFFDRHI